MFRPVKGWYSHSRVLVPQLAFHLHYLIVHMPYCFVLLEYKSLGVDDHLLYVVAVLDLMPVEASYA